jgi:thioredoxin reductase (NADPH)
MAERCDIVIVGGGVAGLTAAQAIASAGLACVCVERMGPGGVVMNLGTVEDCPDLPPETTGPDLAAKLLDQAMGAGATIAFAEVTSIRGGGAWVVETTDGTHEAKAVILATGLTEGSFGIEGEEDLKGRGVSSCAHCDGPMFKDQPVAVAGDDDWAVQEAIELAGGASRVTLVCAGGTPKAVAGRQARLSALSNVSILAGKVVALNANDVGLESVVVDGSAGQTTVPVVFVYTNRRPSIGFLAPLPRLDGAGRPVVGADLETSLRGLFAIGDLRAGAAQSITAAADDGRKAARAAILHCRESSRAANQASAW